MITSEEFISLLDNTEVGVVMTIYDLEFVLNSMPGVVYKEETIPDARVWSTSKVRIKHHPHSGSWYLRTWSYTEERSNITFNLQVVADFCVEYGW